MWVPPCKTERLVHILEQLSNNSRLSKAKIKPEFDLEFLVSNLSHSQGKVCLPEDE